MGLNSHGRGFGLPPLPRSTKPDFWMAEFTPSAGPFTRSMLCANILVPRRKTCCYNCWWCEHWSVEPSPAKSHPMKSIPKIVSGGQTGADRAALDWALEHGLTCGGWCPKGRKAEDGVIEAKYPLKESSSSSYPQRTEWNVRDSDGTVVFSLAPKLTGGSLKTVEFARKHNKHWIHVLEIARRSEHSKEFRTERKAKA
jgi:hypothetical protein